MTGITFKKPGIQHPWSTSHMTAESKKQFIDNIRRKHQMEKKVKIDEQSGVNLYQLKPSLEEPKAQNILMHRCLRSLGVKDIGTKSKFVEKISDIEINVDSIFKSYFRHDVNILPYKKYRRFGSKDQIHMATT